MTNTESMACVFFELRVLLVHALIMPAPSLDRGGGAIQIPLYQTEGLLACD